MNKSLMMGVFSLFFAASALADVRVIPSQIVGDASQIGDVLNVINPKIKTSNGNFSLYPSHTSGEMACSMLGMKLMDISAKNVPRRTVVNLDNGVINFTNTPMAIQVLSCTAK